MAPASAFAEPELELGGFIRAFGAMNLQDHPELNRVGEPIGGRWEPSMLRGTIQLRGAVEFSDSVKINAVGRLDREVKTDYLKDLEDAAVAKGGRRFLSRVYDNTELRELFATVELTDWLTMRVGKQQVVWGETDVLRGTDIIHGYDTRWRSILENENEELRKPLLLGNATISVPAGSLQLIFRPGWDPAANVVNSNDLEGGRWAAQPNKGFDSTSVAPYNFHHSSGDTDDVNYGARWTGVVAQINYSLLYYHGLTLDPVVNSIFNPFGDAPQGPTGAELIFPEVDTYGATFNAYLGFFDTVLRGEFAYTPNKPYNVAGYTTGSALLPPGLPVVLATGVPGLAGIKRKKTLTSMIGFDKNLSFTERLLGTNGPAFWTTQIFDTWLVNYDRDDDIVDLFGYGALKPRHWTVLTSVLALSYKTDTIKPSLGFVYDLTNGDAILIPGVDFVFGDHWRIKAEANLFFADGSRGPFDSPFERKTHLFGTFDNNNQFNVRISYYF